MTNRRGPHMTQAQHRRRRLGLLASIPVAVMTVAAIATAPANAAPAAQQAPADPMKAVAAMQPSWNLGNTLDAIPDETSWGNPLITKATFDGLRAQGFRSVR